MTVDISLTEYQTRVIDGLSPSPADRALAEDPELRKRVRLRWLSGDRLEATATSHVGVVALDCARVHVLPKLVGGELNVLRMVDYASGSRALRPLAQIRSLPVEGLHLRDLVCQLLTAECETLLARGPRRDYVRREEALPTVRGRLLPDRQVLRRFGRLDRLECRFEEFDSDILDNRLCSAGLEVAARTASDPAVRARARRAAADFSALSAPTRLDPREVRPRLYYHRHNEHYRPAHHWALTLLGQGGFADLYSSGDGSGRAFLIDMNTLFESFVTRLLIEGAASEGAESGGVAVRTQRGFRGVIQDGATGDCYAEVRPDILLTRGVGPSVRRLPVDAKYKLYEDRKISQGDLYQLFLYASAISGGDPATACIIYPAPTGTAPIDLAVRHVDGTLRARVRAVAVDVPAVLADSGGAAGQRILASLPGPPGETAGAVRTHSDTSWLPPRPEGRGIL